jgi:hypothetical protein
MVRIICTAPVLAATLLAATPAASAHNGLTVRMGTVWHKHRHSQLAIADSAHRRLRHVDYTGHEAFVARGAHSVYVHAYPGVDVIVGWGGGVAVSVGF